MIEKLFYVLFSIQLYVAVNEFLQRSINFIQPIYVVFLSIGITAFVAFILFVANAGRLFMFLLILFMNFVIIRFGIFYNTIPFVALYLYILSLLKERSILSTRRIFLLSPIVLLGIVPIKWRGIFESNLGEKIHVFLYAPGKAVPPSAGGSTTAMVGSDSFYRSVGIAIEGVKETFKRLPSSQVLIVLLILVIVLIILLLFIAGFYKAARKSVFYKTLMTSIIVGVSVVAVASIIFFRIFIKFYRSTLSSLIAEGKPENMLPKVSQGGIGIKSIVRRTVSSSGFLQAARRLLIATGIIFGIVAIVLGIFLIYVVYNFLFNEHMSETVLLGKIARHFKKQIKEKGVRKSLSEIKNPEEFVKFFYFSVLYLLNRKKFSMKKYETPDEFYERLSKCAKRPLPHFELLTLLFDKIKYGNKKVTDEDVGSLRAHQEELIEAVESIEFKEEALRTENPKEEYT